MPRYSSRDALDALDAALDAQTAPLTAPERQALSQILAIPTSDVTAAHRDQVNAGLAARAASQDALLAAAGHRYLESSD